MSFKRLDAEDFLISADSITATLWSTDTPTLTEFYTSSAQESSATGDYYLNIYQTSSLLSEARVQFAIAYADALGSGSVLYNTGINGKSPTSTLYGQYRSLVLEDENSTFSFGGVNADNFYIISFDRARYKESLFPGSLTLTLTSGSNSQTITDNSNYVTTVEYQGSNRVFQLVSGSAGVRDTTVNANGYTNSSGSYGWLLPDIGVILLNPLALKETTGNGGIGYTTSRTSNTDDENPAVLYEFISDGASFTINSKETISSDYIFIRARNSEFNYTTNASFISGSTGELIYNSFINFPQTYITTIGMYNDNNDLLAVAKLSRPLVKDFTKEILVRTRLDF
jgi:hypothetical protein